MADKKQINLSQAYSQNNSEASNDPSFMCRNSARAYLVWQNSIGRINMKQPIHRCMASCLDGILIDYLKVQ